MSDSLITKKAISTGIKELTKKKIFDKITVSDITQICGLNRQTFYYHFQDKYDLVNWIYYNELITPAIEGISYDNCFDRIYQILSNMKKEDYFYINIFKAQIKTEFEESLFNIVSEVFEVIIDKITSESNVKVETDEIKFIAEFYAFGMTGTIIS